MQPTQGMREAYQREMRASVIAGVVSFIVGLSVVLSIDWSLGPGPFVNLTTLVLGLSLAVIVAVILVVFRPRRSSNCPSCGRQIPFDAWLCPYCGRQLP